MALDILYAPAAALILVFYIALTQWLKRLAVRSLVAAPKAATTLESRKAMYARINAEERELGLDESEWTQWWEDEPKALSKPVVVDMIATNSEVYYAAEQMKLVQEKLRRSERELDRTKLVRQVAKQRAIPYELADTIVGCENRLYESFLVPGPSMGGGHGVSGIVECTPHSSTKINLPHSMTKMEVLEYEKQFIYAMNHASAPLYPIRQTQEIFTVDGRRWVQGYS